MHCIIHSQLLPIFQWFRKIRFVNKLVFGTRYIRYIKLRTFYNVIYHTTVSTFRQFPVPRQFEIFILFVRYNVSAGIATITFCLNASIHHMPRLSKVGTIVVTPSGHCFTIKQKLPSIGNLLFC